MRGITRSAQVVSDHQYLGVEPLVAKEVYYRSMKQPAISIIAAMDEKRGIGKNNAIPWHIPQDLKRFKELTMGHPVIMGRKTHESIGRVLPGRRNIIITRDERYLAAGCVVCHTVESAIEIAKTEEHHEIFVIGGTQIYAQAIDIADRLYLTLVKGAYEADAFFPEYADLFEEVEREDTKSDVYHYSFVTFFRKGQTFPGKV